MVRCHGTLLVRHRKKPLSRPIGPLNQVELQPGPLGRAEELRAFGARQLANTGFCAPGAGQTRLLRVPFEDELSAAILFPGAFVVAGVYRTIFAKTDRIHTTGIHSQANKLFTQSQCTTFPE